MTETIDKLLDAAEAGMRLRGYHAVSFRDLADELGIKSSSVHYYFRQKEDMGTTLVERYSARFFEALEKAAGREDSADDRLEAYCGVYRQALVSSDRICLCGMLGAESCGLPKQLADAVAGFFNANIDWLIEGETGTAQEKRRRAVHILSTLQGAMILAGSLKDHKIFDLAVQGLLEIGQTRTSRP